MTRLSGSEQDLLHSAVKTASDEVAGGLHPTEAVLKAASFHGLPPGGASLVATALNVGRQLALRDANVEPIDKFSGFELAPADGPESAYVSGALGKHADYSGPPTWAKTASDPRTLSVMLHASSAVISTARPGRTSPMRDMLRKRAEYEQAKRIDRSAHYAAEESLLKAAAALHDAGW